jgi:hypothetical protein
MQKYVKDNQVAVLTNPRWGWWSKHQDWNLVFDPVMIQLILSNKKDLIKPLLPVELRRLVDELEIEWLEKGTKFRIEKYRGLEMVTVLVRGTSPTTGSMLDMDQEWIEA